MSRLPLLLAAVSIAFVTGCDGGEGAGPPEQVPSSVEILPAAATLHGLGDTLRLSAQVVDAAGRPMDSLAVTWRSEDPAVVHVDESGLVKAWDGGPAVVTARYAGIVGSADLYVDVGVTDVKLTSERIDWTCGRSFLSLENSGGPGEARVELWGIRLAADTAAPDSLLEEALFQVNSFWTTSIVLDAGCDVRARQLLVLSRDLREDAFRVTARREP